jgi:predicted amidophosphoribosyltransferase
MAEGLSEILKVPTVELVEKVCETDRQATLTASQRKDNLKGSFKGKKIDLKGKTITIVDDVLTTGVTMDLVAKELKKMGAEKVYALTVASVGKKIHDINDEN